jgi:hypothetical protein
MIVAQSAYIPKGFSSLLQYCSCPVRRKGKAKLQAIMLIGLMCCPSLRLNLRPGHRPPHRGGPANVSQQIGAIPYRRIDLHSQAGQVRAATAVETAGPGLLAFRLFAGVMPTSAFPRLCGAHRYAAKPRSTDRYLAPVPRCLRAVEAAGLTAAPAESGGPSRRGTGRSARASRRVRSSLARQRAGGS